MFSSTYQCLKSHWLIGLGISFLALLLVGCNLDKPESTIVENLPLGQLPDSVYPKSYRIDLNIIPHKAQFSGHTEIAIVLTQPADHIWLHGNQLQVHQAQIQLESGQTVTAHYQQLTDIGVAKLTFDDTIPSGAATLLFDYSAPYNESLEGLYRVIDNNEAYAFSQFEATSARLAFPSFDEPRFKVPFDVTLEIDAKHRAVTNTPAINETLLDNGTKRIQYATTKPLPTYLIAFAVGELDEVVWEPVAATALRQNELPLRGYATKGKGEDLAYALEHTADILTTLESYFGTAYPYRKLDIIAVPDFQAGAMENAGAITYREQLILLDEQAPVSQKRRYAEVHAHELAHQWFGNLVTPVWWNDIWLNESFATWMAYKTMDTLVPDGSYAQTKLSDALSAMQHDSLVSTRQIRQPITEHSDIASAFDSITYEKGGAVLSMFERFIGNDAFKAGIQNYMRSFAYKNADARDFIRALAAQRKDLPEGTIEAAFFSFLEQPGTPLVELDWHCQQEKVEVSITQSRYLPLGSSGDKNKQWQLPLCLAYDQESMSQNHCTMITDQVASFTLPSKSCPRYIMPNANASGYYRWTLPNDKWAQLLNSQQWSDAELLSAANSLSAAYHQGDLSTEEYLQTLPHLVASNNNEVIAAPMDDLRLIHNEVIPQEKQHKLRQNLQNLYRGKLAGLEDQLHSDNAIQLRRTLIQFLVQDLMDMELRQQLSKKAQAYTGVGEHSQINPDALNSNLREAALFAAVQELGSTYSIHLKNMMLSSRDALLRQEILRALAGSTDETVLKDVRTLILSPELRDNEIHHIIQPQMANPATRDAMWHWLLDNYEGVLERLPAWAKGKFINPASYFCSKEQYNLISENLADKINALEGGPRALANTLEQINLCAALVNKHKEEPGNYFSTSN